MITVKLDITSKSLNIGDLVASEELSANSSNTEMAKFLARFVVNAETGERYDVEEPDQAERAFRDAKRIPLSRLPEITAQIQGTIEEIKSSAVPLETSGV